MSGEDTTLKPEASLVMVRTGKGWGYAEACISVASYRILEQAAREEGMPLRDYLWGAIQAGLCKARKANAEESKRERESIRAIEAAKNRVLAAELARMCRQDAEERIRNPRGYGRKKPRDEWGNVKKSLLGQKKDVQAHGMSAARTVDRVLAAVGEGDASGPMSRRTGNHKGVHHV